MIPLWLSLNALFLLICIRYSRRAKAITVRSPDPHLTPLVPAVPTQTRRRHGDVWSN